MTGEVLMKTPKGTDTIDLVEENLQILG